MESIVELFDYKKYKISMRIMEIVDAVKHSPFPCILLDMNDKENNMHIEEVIQGVIYTLKDTMYACEASYNKDKKTLLISRKNFYNNSST